MSRFCCLYIPGFPARAAQWSNAELKTKAVLVHQRGRIVAASAAARAAGAQVGWTLAHAQLALPEATLHPLYSPEVAAAWEAVLTQLHAVTPCIESLAPGLAICDVRPPRALLPLVREWGAQAGVADDRSGAELAARTAASGRMRTVREGDTAAFLTRVPVAVFTELEVHPDTVERLQWFGWKSVAHLRSLTRRQLLSQFGAEGEVLFRYAQANATQPVGYFRPAPTLEARYEWDDPVCEPGEIEPVLGLLTDTLCSRLDGEFVSACARRISIGVRQRGIWQRMHRMLREPLAPGEKAPLRRAVQRVWSDLPTGQQIEALEVSLAGLGPQPGVQESLFGPRRPAMLQAVRAVEERYPAALQRVILDPEAYLPEEMYHLEPALPRLERELAAQKPARTKAMRRRDRHRPISLSLLTAGNTP